MNLAMKGGHLIRSSVKGSSAYLVKVEESRSIKVCCAVTPCRFGSTTKVLAKCMLNDYRISMVCETLLYFARALLVC